MEEDVKNPILKNVEDISEEERARISLEKQKQKRIENCNLALQKLLQESKCKLVPFMRMEPNQNPIWGINIAAVD